MSDEMISDPSAKYSFSSNLKDIYFKLFWNSCFWYMSTNKLMFFM